MAPSLSVVVVVYNMARELPRTLRSLAPPSQIDVDVDDYEIIVVDNGSASPLETSVLRRFPGSLRLERIDPAPASPVHAANRGLELAQGEIVGLVIDGARIASPGLLANVRRAFRLDGSPVVTSPAWHIGSVPHMQAADAGYDQDVEDALLARSGWEDDAYRLFSVSTFAGSSGRGWFGPMGESSALFMSRPMWRALGGLDDRFRMPGGGLVNHDLYRRACSLDGAQLVVLLGEGTFHQFHGGIATARRLTWEEMHADYQAIRSVPYRPPENSPLYVGTVPTPALPHLEVSARLAIERRNRLARGVSPAGE